MLSKPVFDAMNEQITHEMYAAYLYLSMSAYFESENLPGFAAWMRKQFHEEQEHAFKFFDFIQDRGANVSLQAIPQVKVDFKSPEEVFALSYEHEQKVTALINRIYDLATENHDVASQVFLHWFIDEQVEEEKNVSDALAMLKKVGSNVGGLFQLDHQMGLRGDQLK